MNNEYWRAMGYPTLLALADIATRNDVTPKVAFNWRERKLNFPKPIMTVANGTMPLYLLEDVERFEATLHRSGTSQEDVPAKNGEPMRKVRDRQTGRFVK